MSSCPLSPSNSFVSRFSRVSCCHTPKLRGRQVGSRNSWWRSRRLFIYDSGSLRVLALWPSRSLPTFEVNSFLICASTHTDQLRRIACIIWLTATLVIMPWRVHTHNTPRLKRLPKRCQCIGTQLAANRVAAHSSPHMTIFNHAHNKGAHGQAYLIGDKGQSVSVTCISCMLTAFHFRRFKSQ